MNILVCCYKNVQICYVLRSSWDSTMNVHTTGNNHATMWSPNPWKPIIYTSLKIQMLVDLMSSPSISEIEVEQSIISDLCNYTGREVKSWMCLWMDVIRSVPWGEHWFTLSLSLLIYEIHSFLKGILHVEIAQFGTAAQPQQKPPIS